MEQKKDSQILGIISRILFVSVIPVLIYCIFSLSFQSFDPGLVILVLITVALGSFMQIQLPRTKIHISLTDAAIFYALLAYNLETAVLLAAVESLFSTFNLRRKGIELRTETIFLNFSVSSLSTFVTGFIAFKLFPLQVSSHFYGDIKSLVSILIVITFSQFLFNSVIISVISSLKNGKSVWYVWFNNCFNALVLYAVSAVVAGLMLKSLHVLDPLLVFTTLSIVLLVHFTYRRYVNEIKETAAKVEQAERDRAEQAEKHIGELQHYIEKLETSSKALKESEKKLRYWAYHDTLTALPNRNKFLERLQFLLESPAIKQDSKIAVLHLNLDRFKTINDSLGHSTGNNLLKNVAKRIKNLIGKEDLAARFGSDEFAILLSNIANLEEAIVFAEKLNTKISEPFTLDGKHVFTSASIGIAVNFQPYNNAENFLRDANIAMYHAKESELTYAVFDQNMHTRVVSLLQLETDLRYAIERNELSVYYQPILDLDSIELIGFEALMRWQHPHRGLVPPGEFIPVSEKTGLIVPMSLWILRKSCEKVVEWQNKKLAKKSLIISVNLSGKHFAQPDLVEQIRRIIIETGIDVKCLKLEITESAVMENAESAVRMLKQLREIGIQLSIDDFGTGYSSLSYLHSFPINTLKIDRSFVRMMEDGSENGEIVKTIIALARSLNLSVIAEGIESIHQFHQLRVLGCEYGQGYLFSRPVPEEEAARLLTDSLRWKSILPSRQADISNEEKEEFPVLELDDVMTKTHETIQ